MIADLVARLRASAKQYAQYIDKQTQASLLREAADALEAKPQFDCALTGCGRCYNCQRMRADAAEARESAVSYGACCGQR